MKTLLARLPKLLVIALVLGGVARMAWVALVPSGEAAPPQALQLPRLSEAAAAGKRAFDASCAQCHGPNGTGTEKGPPLIHRIYNPGHHADESFFRAVRDGVRQHHWSFGNMPPQPKVTEKEVADIVAYVREVQEANGIRYQEHRM